MDKLAELAARVDIQDCLFRYARGVDRRDWASVRETYHDDATDEHGEFSGTVDGFIEWVSRRHQSIPFAAHFLGNCLIEFLDQNTAVAETYFIAMQRRTLPASMREGGSEIDAEVIGRYVDRFERRGDDRWRVAKRRVVYDSSRIRQSTHNAVNAGSIGTRDRNDPIFAVLRQIG